MRDSLTRRVGGVRVRRSAKGRGAGQGAGGGAGLRPAAKPWMSRARSLSKARKRTYSNPGGFQFFFRGFSGVFERSAMSSCAIVVTIAHDWGVGEGARVFARLPARGFADQPALNC